MSNGDPGVVYTTKELLAKIEAKVDAVLLSLATKVDHDYFEQRLEHVIARVRKLENQAAADQAVSAWQRWFFGAVCIGALGAVATLVWLAVGGH